MILSLVFLSLLCSVSASPSVAKSFLKRVAKNVAIGGAAYGSLILAHDLFNTDSEDYDEPDPITPLKPATDSNLVSFGSMMKITDSTVKAYQNDLFFDYLKNDRHFRVKAMLQSGVNPNLTDAEGNDFLDYALMYSNIGDLLSLAILKGLDVNKLNEKTKLLPLDRALEYEDLRMARILVEAGALSSKSYEELINQIIKLRHDHVVFDFVPNSMVSTSYRFILAVYRASGRDKTLIKNAHAYAFRRKKIHFQIFLENIAKYDTIWP